MVKSNQISPSHQCTQQDARCPITAYGNKVWIFGGVVIHGVYFEAMLMLWYNKYSSQINTLAACGVCQKQQECFQLRGQSGHQSLRNLHAPLSTRRNVVWVSCETICLVFTHSLLKFRHQNSSTPWGQVILKCNHRLQQTASTHNLHICWFTGEEFEQRRRRKMQQVQCKRLAWLCLVLHRCTHGFADIRLDTSVTTCNQGVKSTNVRQPRERKNKTYCKLRKQEEIETCWKKHANDHSWSVALLSPKKSCVTFCVLLQDFSICSCFHLVAVPFGSPYTCSNLISVMCVWKPINKAP